MLCEAWIVNPWQEYLTEESFIKLNHSKKEKTAFLSAMIHQVWTKNSSAKYHFSSRVSSLV